MTHIPVLMAALLALAAAGAPGSGNAQGAGRGLFFDDADTNGNGKVSREEYIRARSAYFDKLDRTGDGLVSAEDFPTVERHPEAAQRLDDRIYDADMDHDGKVSREELSKAPIPLFERADTDDDGVVTEAERAAFRGH